MKRDAKNILFLMTDQHRTDTLPAYGNTVVHTPALDRIANEATRFDRMYTPTSICTPARGSLMTGLQPFRHGLLVNPERGGPGQVELPEGSVVWSQVLRQAGYNVGLSGKWHVGRHRGPDYYGFDGEHMPGAFNPCSLPAYEDWLLQKNLPKFGVRDAVFSQAPNGTGRGHLYAGRLTQPFEGSFETYITERALEMLERYARDFHKQAKPFALVASWFGPHLPYLIPDEYYDMYDPEDVVLPQSFSETFEDKPPVQKRYSEYWSCDGFDADTWRKLIAVYWGYVTMIDRCMDRLLNRLVELDLWDTTNLIFTADHGEFTGAHRMQDKGPAMYEDIYRIPGLIRTPGGRTQSCKELVSLIDLPATMLDIAGVADAMETDGQSLMPLVNGALCTSWRKELVCEFHGHHFGYQQRMIVDDRFKLVVNPESVCELYDLQNDPHELKNLYQAPKLRDIRNDLAARLYRELIKRGDPAATWLTYMAPIGDARVAAIRGVAELVDDAG